MDGRVVLGIDGGGTAIVARAESRDGVVFEGRGGPGNALSTAPGALEHHLSIATDGCPTPTVVAGCFAGMSNDTARGTVAAIVRRRFPGATVRLAPDYVAVVLASNGSDVVVIAGTGSVAASRIRGRITTTGGLGYLLGDRGSGFRYGQALVEFAVTTGPRSMPPVVRSMLLEEVGSLHPSEIVRRVHMADSPAELLAVLLAVLGACAADGDDWAVQLIEREAAVFAQDVAEHTNLHVAKTEVRIELAGNVWASDAITTSFVRSLEASLRERSLHVTRATDEPVVGAIRLATMADEAFAELVHQGRALHGTTCT